MTGALLQRIVTAAVTEVPGAQHAGITLLEHGQLSAPAATDDLVVQIDRVQYETGEGPCAEAATEHATGRSDDLQADARVPRFARRAADMGVRSMLSFQLFTEADSMGG